MACRERCHGVRLDRGAGACPDACEACCSTCASSAQTCGTTRHSLAAPPAKAIASAWPQLGCNPSPPPAGVCHSSCLQADLASSVAALGCTVETTIGRGPGSCPGGSSSDDVCWVLRVSSSTEIDADTCKGSLAKSRCARSSAEVILFEARDRTASVSCGAEPELPDSSTAGGDLSEAFTDTDGFMCGGNIHTAAPVSYLCQTIRWVDP